MTSRVAGPHHDRRGVGLCSALFKGVGGLFATALHSRPTVKPGRGDGACGHDRSVLPLSAHGGLRSRVPRLGRHASM